MSESKTFLQRFNALRDEIKAPKNCLNKFGGYKYRNLEGIQEALKPLALKHDVTIVGTDALVEVAGRLFYQVTYTAMDSTNAEGVTLTHTAWAEHPAAKKGMDPAQLTGAVSSYARKYALGGLLMLDDTEDADNGGSYNPPQRPSKREAMLARIDQLTAKATASGVRPEAFGEWLVANFGTGDKEQLTDEQLTEYGKYLSTICKDAESLKG